MLSKTSAGAVALLGTLRTYEQQPITIVRAAGMANFICAKRVPNDHISRCHSVTLDMPILLNLLRFVILNGS
jgi:hypothetical protein